MRSLYMSQFFFNNVQELPVGQGPLIIEASNHTQAHYTR